MADTAIWVVTEILLHKVLSFAADEISLAWNMKKELEKLGKEIRKIRALLLDAHRSRITSEFVQDWLKDLQSLVLDAEIVLDEYGYKVLRQKIECHNRGKVRNLFSSSNPVFSRRKIALRIKDVLSSFEELYSQSIQIGFQEVQLVHSDPDPKEMRLTVPFVEVSKIVGREGEISKLINMLIVSEYKEDLPVITILGMGGQGKTTLAQLIFKNEKINNYFDKVIWVCVSNDFTVERLLGEMLQSLTETNHQLTSSQALVNKLKCEMRGKRYLIVFDDIWNRDREVWNRRMRACLLEIQGLKDSKILATTRDEDVASAMEATMCHRLQELSSNESQSLFEKCAFAEGGAIKTPQLVEIGARILKKCGGVPLAIKTIGGLLYSKNSVDEWLVVEKSDCWSAGGENAMVLSTIKLSYDNLPSLSIKQCFAYCAIFEKGTWIEKDQLIRLWMAQGLLNPPNRSQLQMEEVGENYFNILLKNSLLQDARMDGLNNITHCKMHDLVNDVSLKLSKNYCCNVKDLEVRTTKIEAIHLSISSGLSGMRKRLKDVLPSKLRTLHLKGRIDLSEDLFQNFKCLSTLIVDNSDAKELPNSIGKSKHLRFLDIGGCYKIKRLPKSFTKLYYLQTLIVWELEELPDGFGNLINLRHIHMNGSLHSEVFSEGLSKLKILQTFPCFWVGKQIGCQMEEMKHLDNLKGTLRIFDLQNVGSYDSAMKSNLFNKLNIQILELEWDGRDEDRDDNDVVEGLKPHLNLKSLCVIGCQNSKFPSWMVRENDLLPIGNLVKLSLERLDKCERLPSLGDLSFLKDLEIRFLPKVKRIEREFYGCRSNFEWATKSGNSNNVSEIITLFPALKRLVLGQMDGLIEWSDATEIQSTIDSWSSSSVQFKIFPYLEEICIYGLPNLSVFPNLGSLPSLKRLEVLFCENVTIRDEWIESTQKLGIDDEGHLYASSNIQCYFSSLRELNVEYCDNLIAPLISSPIMNLVQLESLGIHCHPNSWPKDLHHLINLGELQLRAVTIRKEEEFDCYPVWPYPKSDFVSLTSLKLDGSPFPKVKCLPDQIQYLTALINLEIHSFDGLEALPEWLGNLQSFKSLVILSCKNFKHLPSMEAFQRLTNLQSLRICRCPLPEGKWKRGSGSEWIKIAHIPHLKLPNSCFSP